MVVDKDMDKVMDKVVKVDVGRVVKAVDMGVMDNINSMLLQHSRRPFLRLQLFLPREKARVALFGWGLSLLVGWLLHHLPL